MFCLLYCIISNIVNVIFFQFYVGLAIFCSYNPRYVLRLVFNYFVLCSYTLILTIYCVITCFNHGKFLKVVLCTFPIAESVLGIRVDLLISADDKERIKALQKEGKVRRQTQNKMILLQTISSNLRASWLSSTTRASSTT